MQIENRIARGRIRIVTRITTPCVMTARMRTVDRFGHGAETFEIVAACLELVLHVRGAGVGGPDG